MSKCSLVQTKKFSNSSNNNQKTRITETSSKICQNCKLIKQQMEAQIFSLKNKAHQSFMQVISQVQQLHEEELELMKQEYECDSQNSKNQISKLQQALKLSKQEAQIIQKNLKQHTYDLDDGSFLVQNIDIIHCHQNQKSYLNDSSLSQFTDFLSNGLNQNVNTSSTNVNFKQTKNQIMKQANKSGLQSLGPALQKKLQQLYNTVTQLQSDVSYLQQKNEHMKRQKQDYQNKYNTIKANYDSLFKESKFMSDHIRNISSQKLRLQRKVKQMEKQLNSKSVFQSQHFHQQLSEEAYSPTIKISVNHPSSAQKNNLSSSYNNNNNYRSKECSPLVKQKSTQNPYLNIKNYDYFVDEESNSNSVNTSNKIKQKSFQEDKKSNKKYLQKSSPYRRQLTVSQNYERQDQDKSMMKQIRQGLKLKTLLKKSQTNLEKPVRGSIKKTSLHLPPAPNSNIGQN